MNGNQYRRWARAKGLLLKNFAIYGNCWQKWIVCFRKMLHQPIPVNRQGYDYLQRQIEPRCQYMPLKPTKCCTSQIRLKIWLCVPVWLYMGVSEQFLNGTSAHKGQKKRQLGCRWCWSLWPCRQISHRNVRLYKCTGHFRQFLFIRDATGLVAYEEHICHLYYCPFRLL